MGVHEDPNFPSNLDIRPLVSATSDADARFDTVAQEGAIKSYGIAGRIWEASHAMLAYLDPSSPLEFDPPPPTPSASTRVDGAPITAIELGSGTGFVAARVADSLRPGCDLLIATDLPEVCPMLEMNLHASPALWVRPLAWGSRDDAQVIARDLGLAGDNGGSSPRRLTHVLCSDLIYFPSLLAPLLRSLLHLTSAPFVEGSGSEPICVVLSYKMRSLAKETSFWNAFGLWFDFVPVLSRPLVSTRGDEPLDRSGSAQWSRFSPGDPEDETFVIIAKRRADSLFWTEPDEDSKLLAGVGASGSDQPKSDDQFEQLLLMGMDL
ncbi:putative methyltransferase-domain-containing protein [Trametes maxima]|nr:putative methyltransferase-domain-containing protein [Trametes maxima]